MRKAIVSNTSAKTLAFWEGLVSGKISFSDLLASCRAAPELTHLTLDTTGICDLSCEGMCYYHPDINVRERAVPVEALEEAVKTAHEELGLKNLVFSGKEPLLKADIFFRLARFGAALPEPKLAIGLVTNGRSITKHWNQLESLVRDDALTFLDVSLDSGNPTQHDSIRGVNGTFERAFASLERCAREWPTVRVSSASVLRHDNATGILELIRRAAPFNQHFFVIPIQPPPFSTTLPLRWDQIRTFLEQVIALLTGELRNANVEVMISLLGLYLSDAERNGFFQWREIREDALGQCYVEQEVGGNRLQLHLQVLPDTGWRIARITYTGAYLPNTHFLQDSRPERFSVGFVQKEPLCVLYQRALATDGVLGKILLSRDHHACRERPCWNCCFGGMAGAENSFVGGAGIECQPTLCLKTDGDFADRSNE